MMVNAITSNVEKWEREAAAGVCGGFCFDDYSQIAVAK